ncbi:helix-turn-helix domain-containing protein [Paenibacillus tarimensis]
MPDIKFKSYSLRTLVITLSIFAIILIALCGGLLYSKANQVMIEEVAKESLHRVENIKAFIETTLLAKYENAFSDKVMATISTKNREEIRYFLDHSEEDNLYRVSRLRNDLELIQSAHLGIEDITLYFEKSGFVVDTNYYYEDALNSEEYDFINGLSTSVPHQWFQRVRPDGREVLTYIFTLPYKAQSDKIKGYMYIDIDIQYIEHMLDALMSSPDEAIYIIDKAGNSIISTTSTNQINLMQLNQWMSEADFKVESIEGRKTVVTFSKAGTGDNDWNYIVVRPMQSFFLSAQKLQRDIVLVCLIVMVIGLLTSYLISRRLHLPLRKMVADIRRIYGASFPAHQGNEYKYINQVIFSMDMKISSLHNQLKNEQFHSLLRGNLQEMDDLPIPPDSSYLIGYIRLHSGNIDTFRTRYQKMGHVHPYRIITINPRETAVLYILHQGEVEHDSNDQIRSEIEKFKILTRNDFVFSVGLGNLVRSYKEIPNSYDKALQSLEYVYLYGYGAILLYRDIIGRRGWPEKMDYDRLETALSAGNIQTTTNFIHKFQEKMMDSDYSLEVIHLAVVRLTATLYQVMLRHELQDVFKVTADFFTSFKKDTLKETLHHVLEYCQKVVRFIEDSQNNTRTSTMIDIKNYIDQNLDQDISLDALSERFSFSISYISRTFSEIFQVSFSEYLTGMRLERAAESLCGSSKSVTEISSMVGYRNVQYFCTKFKNKYGVTPSQYRKSMQGKKIQDPDYI